MRVLLDTNILIDVLQSREPWCYDGQKIFLLAAEEKFDACITANTVADIHYLMKFNLHDEKKTRTILKTLFQLFEILDTCSIDCEKALHSSLRDYEDALMNETAAREKISCIITRNIKDFQNSSIQAYLPSEFLKQFTKNKKAF